MNQMDPDTYSAISGAHAARADISAGTPNYHRDISNSPSYRDAYDTVIAASKVDCPVCERCVHVADRIPTHRTPDGEECIASRTLARIA